MQVPTSNTQVGSNPSPAGRVVGRLNSYNVGETKLTELYTDAGITALGDAGISAFFALQC